MLQIWILNSSTHSQPSSLVSEHPNKSSSYAHPAFQTSGSTKIPIYVGLRSQRSPSAEKRLRKSQSREPSQEPSPTSQDPSRKSEQRSPEDDSSLLSISGMTSDNEYESNVSESSGEASKPTQKAVKGYIWDAIVVVMLAYNLCSKHLIFMHLFFRSSHSSLHPFYWFRLVTIQATFHSCILLLIRTCFLIIMIF